MKKVLIISSVIVIFFVAAVAFRIFQSAEKKHHFVTKAIPIKVITVTSTNYPVFVTAQGTAEASQSVAVQSQVTGIIKKIGINPGAYVTQGQLLFQIDPTKYQTTLAKDEAEYHLTKKNFERYSILMKKGFISKVQYDQTKAQLAQDFNTVKFDQAQLNYTTILAPIDGKTGNIIVKEGDLATASSKQPLVTINQFSPILVDFYLPQTDLPELMQYQNQNTLRVESYGANNQILAANGRVSFVDNAVNSSTGTILLKATFPNLKNILFPGQSITLKLIFTKKQNTLMIPTRCIQSDEHGNFVYRIINNHAVVTRITVIRQLGSATFIKNGLARGDQVAEIFPPNLTNGSLVKSK